MSDDILRPTYLEVNLPQLRQNLENIKSHVKPARVLAVVKANAYGHGVDLVGPYIAPYADYLGVAIVQEGVHLRQIGVQQPVLVMGASLPGQAALFAAHRLTMAVSSIPLLEAAEAAADAA